MPSMVVLLLSAVLTHTPTPEKIVLWNDPAAVSFEQTLVRHMLMQTLTSDASTSVWSDVKLAPRERRAFWLRRRAARDLVRARNHLDTLSVDAAMVESARARQKLTRVAVLTGDPLPLCESLTLLAASLLLQGATQAGQQVLEELLVLDPSFSPPASLYNPVMKRRVERVRARLAKALKLPLTVQSTDVGAALFVDGVFVGFERAEVSVIPGVPHLVWALGKDGQHKAIRLAASDFARPAARTACLALDAPEPVPELSPERMQPALEASRSHQLALNLRSPSLRAMRVERILVLAYAEGELTLTHLQLEPSERRRVRAPALVTDMREASKIAQQLLAKPPALEPLPTPPRRLSPHASSARL